MPRFHQKWVFAIAVCLGLVLASPSAVAQSRVRPQNVHSLPMSSAERTWLDQHSDVRVGMWLGSPPIIFRGESGEFQGVVPAYVDIVFRKLGVTIRPVQASSFAALWELAKAGEVDVVAAVTPISERSADMLMSKPYFSLPIVVVTRSEYPFIAGLDDLDGKVVAMEKGHVPHLKIPNDYPDIIPLLVSNPKEGVRAVKTGQADAFVVAEAAILYLSREHEIADIRIAAITEYSYRIAFGIRNDWPVLRRLIDRALAFLTDDERDEIQDHWIRIRHGRWADAPYVWRLLIGASIILAVLMGLILFWNRRLAGEIRLRIKAQTELRRAHETSNLVVESADIIIVGLDYDGTVQLFNKAGENITGYSREEVLGQNWFNLIVPKERFPYVWDEFARLQRDGTGPVPDTFENPILTKSGDIRQILWRNSVVSEGNGNLASISFGTDITNRLRAEEELRLTQFAMDNAAVGVFRVLPAGHIVYANRTAAAMLGFSRSELKRRTVPEIVPGITQEKWPELWDRLKFRKMLVFEQSLRRKDGSSIPIEVTAYYIMFKGAELAIGFFPIFRNGNGWRHCVKMWSAWFVMTCVLPLWQCRPCSNCSTRRRTSLRNSGSFSIVL